MKCGTNNTNIYSKKFYLHIIERLGKNPDKHIGESETQIENYIDTVMLRSIT